MLSHIPSTLGYDSAPTLSPCFLSACLRDAAFKQVEPSGSEEVTRENGINFYGMRDCVTSFSTFPVTTISHMFPNRELVLNTGNQSLEVDTKSLGFLIRSTFSAASARYLLSFRKKLYSIQSRTQTHFWRLLHASEPLSDFVSSYGTRSSTWSRIDNSLALASVLQVNSHHFEMCLSPRDSSVEGQILGSFGRAELLSCEAPRFSKFAIRWRQAIR